MLEGSTASLARLPVELLHKIVVLAVVQYLDEVIAGPLYIPSAGGLLSERDPDFKARRESLRHRDCDDIALGGEPNPVIPFFSASYQLRDIVLKVLSDILGIPLVRGPISRYVVP